MRICLLKNRQPSNASSTLTNGYFSWKLKPYFEFSPLCPLYTTRNSLIMSLRSCWLRLPSSSTVCRSRSAHPLLSGVSYTRARIVTIPAAMWLITGTAVKAPAFLKPWSVLTSNVKQWIFSMKITDRVTAGSRSTKHLSTNDVKLLSVIVTKCFYVWGSVWEASWRLQDCIPQQSFYIAWAELGLRRRSTIFPANAGSYYISISTSLTISRAAHDRCFSYCQLLLSHYMVLCLPART